MKNQNKYVAIDSSGDRPRYLHLCGKFLTTSQFWAWSGTIEQFFAITEQNEWDNLRPLSVDKMVR